MGTKRDHAFKTLSPVPGTERVCKTFAGIVTTVPGYLCYVPCTARQALMSQAPPVHQTLYYISEIQTISYKDHRIIPSPTEEQSKAQRGAIIHMRSHSQKGRSWEVHVVRVFRETESRLGRGARVVPRLPASRHRHLLGVMKMFSN